MPAAEKIFQEESIISFGRRHRRILLYNVLRYNEAFTPGKNRRAGLEPARDIAPVIRKKTIFNPGHYLDEFRLNP